MPVGDTSKDVYEHQLELCLYMSYT